VVRRDYCLWQSEATAHRGRVGRRPGNGPAPPPLGTLRRAEHACSGAPTTPPSAATSAVGAGPTGVQDLLGNLREWTASEPRPYPYRPDDGREAAGPRAARVVRGASHDDPPETLRVTIRRFYSYDGPHRGLAGGHHHVGFRCATSEDLGGY
jgi:formylglycine-generating enzyme required for sulfatase activity